MGALQLDSNSPNNGKQKRTENRSYHQWTDTLLCIRISSGQMKTYLQREEDKGQWLLWSQYVTKMHQVKEGTKIWVSGNMQHVYIWGIAVLSRGGTSLEMRVIALDAKRNPLIFSLCFLNIQLSVRTSILKLLNWDPGNFAKKKFFDTFSERERWQCLWVSVTQVTWNWDYLQLIKVLKKLFVAGDIFVTVTPMNGMLVCRLFKISKT